MSEINDMLNQCKHCQYWSDEPESFFHNMRVCRKMTFHPEVDRMVYEVYFSEGQGYQQHETGPEFGCIHFAPRRIPSNGNGKVCA